MSNRYLIALLSIILIGCGKKSAPPAADTAPPKPRESVSVDGLLGSKSEPSLAPPPAGSTPALPASADAPVGEPAQAGVSVSPQDAERAEKAYNQRLSKHVKWLQGMQKGSEQDRQRILAEIRGANLPDFELAELEGLKPVFGVTASFK